jgi:hypothetical protein
VDTVITDAPAWWSLRPEVVAEVARRRRGLLDRARGRLLDLDEPGALAVLGAASAQATGAPGREVAGREHYDSIVSTCRLVELADLGRALAGLDLLLADGGELHLVEPANWPGPGGLVASSLGALLPAVRGLHLSRDVVRTVRSVGLTAADVDRFTIATPVWPLRRFVQIRAVRIPVDPAAGRAAGRAAGSGGS